LPTQSLINSIGELTAKDLGLVKELQKAAIEFVGEEEKSKYWFGFHAIPSMTRLHLHIISKDLCSASLKNKKHYLSFTTPFFQDISKVIRDLESGNSINVDEKAMEQLLKGPLKCHHCSVVFPTIPKLKHHLAEAFPL
jgi:aprataxin